MAFAHNGILLSLKKEILTHASNNTNVPITERAVYTRSCAHALHVSLLILVLLKSLKLSCRPDTWCLMVRL